MTESTPIPGIWYKHPSHLVLFCYTPQMPNDPLPWTDNLGRQWRDQDSVKPPYDLNETYTNAPMLDASRLEIAYNPHGDMHVKVEWGSLEEDDGEFEPEVTYGEGFYEWEPFSRDTAKEYADACGETLVTRTVTTFKTPWEKVTDEPS